MPSGSPQQLQHLVAEYVQRLCACIEAAKDAHTVEALLQQARDILYLHAVTPNASSHADQQTAAASSAAPAGATLSKAISAPPVAAPGTSDTGDVASGLAGQAAAVQRCAACFATPHVAVWHTFSGTPFTEFAGCLLSVVAPDWLPLMAAPQRESLFDAWFLHVPVSAALLALTTHLALVQPLYSDSYSASGGGGTVSAIAADTAARLLATLFAATHSRGTQGLVAEVAASAAGAGGWSRAGSGWGASSGIGTHSVDEGMGQGTGTTGPSPEPLCLSPNQGLAAEVDSDEVAAVLASIPERAAATRLPALRPLAFTALLVEHLLEAYGSLGSSHKGQPHRGATEATESSAGNGSGGGGGPSPTATDPCREGQDEGANPSGLPATEGFFTSGETIKRDGETAGGAFVGLVLSKLSRRGHARLVGRALWRSIRQVVIQPQVNGGDASAVRGGGKQLAPVPVFGVPRSLGPAGAAFAQVADPAAAEKLTEALLLEMAAARVDDTLGTSIVGGLFGGALWSRGDIRFLLTEKLFTQRALPLPALRWLVGFLGGADRGRQDAAGEEEEALLAGVTLRLAQSWGDAATVTGTPVKQQACLSAALVEAVRQLGKAPIERHPGLLPALLAGVSVRLESPLPAIRRQGMRVGAAFSAALDPDRPPLFSDTDTTLLPEEVWHRSALGDAKSSRAAEDTSAAAVAAAVAAAAKGTGASAGGGVETGTDSDDDSLAPYDLSEGEDNEAGMKAGGRQPLQLRDVAAALRKEDDVAGVLAALALVDGLVAAAPDELDQYAGARALCPMSHALVAAAPDELDRYADALLVSSREELGRSLLHTRVPEWAEVDAHQAKPTDQRFRALVALLAAAPQRAGAALGPEVYSSHLDMQQRLLVLDAMGAAAELMSTPPRLLDSSALHPALDPHVKPHQRLVAAAEARVSEAGSTGRESGRTGSGEGSEGRGDALTGEKTRVWGVRSLAQRSAAPKRTFRNRFPVVALQWFQALLADCGAARHGVDLFGRDSLLLGRLLATLGRFVAAASPAPVTAHLASATIELIRTPQVAMHVQPFVRRAALYAAAQVVSALPPARLAGALLGGASDTRDTLLVERLEWLREWTSAMSVSDADEQCRMLAGSCRSLQATLASQALEAIDSGSADWAPGQSTDLLSVAMTAASANPGISIALPQGLSEMQLR